MRELQSADIRCDTVREKLGRLETSIGQIVKYACSALVTNLDKNIRFRFRHSAFGDVLSEAERAQHICFVIKYENFPVLEQFAVVQDDGKYYIGNLQYVLHVINAYRSIIQNKDDSIYYKRIATRCDRMTKCVDASKGLALDVEDIDGNNVTAEFRAFLSERTEAITRILRPLDFDYIYNGLLQHADETYSKRLNEDYCSGELNYILLKHAHLLGHVKELLIPFHKILAIFNFPRLGAM